MFKTLFHPTILVLTFAYGLSFPLINLGFASTAVANWALGLSGAAPALAWLLFTPAIPFLLRHVSFLRLAQLLLIVALLAWVSMALWRDPIAWIALRLVFGGSLGLFFRCVEFWLNSTSDAGHRGRKIGQYGAVFLGGIILGSAAQPVLGDGIPAFALVAAGLAAALLLLSTGHPFGLGKLALTKGLPLGRLLSIAPEGLAAAMVYGIFEAIPITFLPLEAVQLGFSPGTAALSVSAFVLGALLGTVPSGVVSDRFGRAWVMRVAAVWGLVGALCLPWAAGQGEVAWLAVVFFWAFGTQGLYGVALALIGDRFTDRSMESGLQANMAFGMAYAMGALLGPLYIVALGQISPGAGLSGTAALLFGLFALVVLVARPKTKEQPA